jgi:hypothetical protein
MMISEDYVVAFPQKIVRNEATTQKWDVWKEWLLVSKCI